MKYPVSQRLPSGLTGANTALQAKTPASEWASWCVWRLWALAARGSELPTRSRGFTVVFGAALPTQMGPLQLFFGFLGTVSRHYFAPHTPRGLSAGGAGDSGHRLARGGPLRGLTSVICAGFSLICRDPQGSAEI